MAKKKVTKKKYQPTKRQREKKWQGTMERLEKTTKDTVMSGPDTPGRRALKKALDKVKRRKRPKS